MRRSSASPRSTSSASSAQPLRRSRRGQAVEPALAGAAARCRSACGSRATSCSATPMREPHRVRLGGDVVAGDRGPPAVGRQQGAEHADGGGLAGAVGAEEAVDLAPPTVRSRPSTAVVSERAGQAARGDGHVVVGARDLSSRERVEKRIRVGVTHDKARMRGDLFVTHVEPSVADELAREQLLAALNAANARLERERSGEVELQGAAGGDPRRDGVGSHRPDEVDIRGIHAVDAWRFLSRGAAHPWYGSSSRTGSPPLPRRTRTRRCRTGRERYCSCSSRTPWSREQSRSR